MQQVQSTIVPPPIQPNSVQSVYPQGSTDFARDVAASLINKLNRYLTSNIKQFEELKDAIPLVRHAVELYMQNDYNQSIIQSFQSYLYIDALRASTGRGLPAL